MSVKVNYKTVINGFLVIIVSALMVACSPVAQMNDQNVALIKQSLAEKNDTGPADPKNMGVKLDDDTINTLTPALTVAKQPEEKFDVSVTDMPASEFFYSLMQSTPYSIAVSPNLNGNISLQLKNVTVSDVLTAVHNLYGYRVDKNNYGYTIYPQQLETRMFVLHRLNMGREANSESSITNPGLGGTTSNNNNSSRSKQVNAVSVKSKFTNEHYWDQISDSITSIVSQTPGASVKVNEETGVILVRATPEELAQVAQFIQMTANIASRQVLIEAKIMEVTLNKAYSTGINWSQMGLDYDSTTGIVAINPPVSADLEGFDSVIKLLSTQGQVTVLSSPRVATINNQQALIKVGNDSYYVTDVSTDTTPVGTTAQLSSDVTLEPFFSGIALEVLPNIEKNGHINLFIHPVISVTADDEKTIELSDTQTLVLPLASSSVRESDSIVNVRDNQIIILGGLMESSAQTSHSTFPFLQDTGHETDANDVGSITELVIMLKATIIDSNQDWNAALQDSANNLTNVMQQYSQGMA